MHRDVPVESRLEDLFQRCRAAGMTVTPQRLAIYRALLEAEDHPTPEALYQRVRLSMPSLSLATIYKVLDALTKLGVVKEVHVSGDSKRYDANLDKHHHLVCTRCKKVRDVYNEQFDTIMLPKRFPGFVAQTVSVQVFGLCAACAQEEAK
ncbi:MAG TPA: Fur family transcriptional regulator [Methylomirabilota bacterium]|nr:Fur family transcriptional regulator [Methylomirabilota bacterium]